MTFNIKVYIDWNRDFDFADTYEDVSNDVIEVSWTLGMGQAYQEMADGAALHLRLRNDDQKYLPGNSGSPIYPNVLPYRPIKITADTGGTAETTLWRGWLEKPQGIYNKSGEATGADHITFTAFDGREVLLDNEVPIALKQNVTGDIIIGAVLDDAATLPGGEGGGSDRTLDTGQLTIDVFGDMPEARAWEVLAEVTRAERGRGFLNRAGQFEWWNRHHMIKTTTVSGTVTDTQSDYAFQDIAYETWRDLANVVRVTTEGRRETGISEQLWKLDGTYEVPAGGTKIIEATLRTDDGRFAGSGSVTATPTFSAGTATVNVSAKGNRARITLVNSGADAILSGLTLDGEPITAQDRLDIEKSDSSSITSYGRRALPTISLGALSNADDAEQVALYELQRRKDPVGVVDYVEFVRATGAGVDASFLVDWDLGSRVAVNASKIGHQAEYFVIGEEWTWANNVATVRKFLEPADPQNYWLVGVVGFSEVGQTTVVGY